MMTNGKKALTLITLILFALVATGCGNIRKLKEIEVNSVGVKYFTPTGNRSAEAVLLLEVDNPAMGLTLSNVEGTVKLDGEPLGYFTAGELPLQGKSVQVYELPCTASLAEKVSLLRIMALVARMDLEGVTVDLKLHARLENGLTRTLTYDNLELKQFTSR